MEMHMIIFRVHAMDIWILYHQLRTFFTMGRKSKVETDSSNNTKSASRNRGRREGSSSKSKVSINDPIVMFIVKIGSGSFFHTPNNFSSDVLCTKPKKEEEVESHHDVECATALLDQSVEDKNEVQCARALLEISGQTTGDRRVSRRLAGLEPELRNDFDFNRALEYVIKDKPQQ
ncbi:hypothetical protein DH2020_035496 [Rehmannia glutinosa]|uniref:Uncharacterized protein n=1 Tax=Rehmannia glutinosa TaxID=99300 RepID=A0ABR0V9I0_REHGL